MHIATGESVTPITNTRNPSRDERASTEQHRADCLARWQESHKQEAIEKSIGSVCFPVQGEVEFSSSDPFEWTEEQRKSLYESSAFYNRFFTPDPDAKRWRLPDLSPELELASVQAWNEYAARNRQDNGLGHLTGKPYRPAVNDIVSVDPSSIYFAAESLFYCVVENVGENPAYATFIPLIVAMLELNLEPRVEAFHAIEFKVGIQDVEVKSTPKNTSVKHHATGHSHKRGKITELSRKSTQRMKTHIRNTSPENIKAFLTLTYPNDFPCDGRKVKRDLDAMIKVLRRLGVGSGIWFEEFQERGAPHFHAFLSTWPIGGVKAVAKAWFRIVGSGDKKHYLWHVGKLSGKSCLEWFRKPHAASAYATKYATKAEQKAVPEQFHDVGRFWGYWGEARPIWRYISGRGWYSVETAGKAILNHRAQFSTSEQLDKWSGRAYYSGMMWGGSADLEDMLSSIGWCPF